MAATPTLDDLRRYAVARTLFTPTTLSRAMARLGFVQADPIRAPARAQDLTLRHRVFDYRAGDLERRYPRLAIEDDYFVNYGFLARSHQALMHPRTARDEWSAERWQQAQAVLEFVRKHKAVHPRDVDAHFSHGRVQNWFGGSTNASTQLLDGMHYRGLLRIARRDSGVRVYAPRDATPAPADEAERSARHDALVDLIIAAYAPLPWSSLAQLVSHLAGGVPQWRAHRLTALQRARARSAVATVNGLDWVWPAGENPRAKRHVLDDEVRLLAPFDPVVWDRKRFELLWGWAYRFEAYTPAPKRVRGYYALPLLWRGHVIGWGNVSAAKGAVKAELGYVAGKPPAGAAYRAALDDELQRLSVFLQPANA